MRKRTIGLVAIMLLATASCAKTNTTTSTSKGITSQSTSTTTNKKAITGSISPEDVVGLAAIKAIQSDKTKTKLASLNETVSENVYSYPFEEISILNAVQYDLALDNQDTKMKFITDVCGTNDLRIIFSEFEATGEIFVEATETKEAYVEATNITDMAVTVYGDKGQYTILANSYKNMSGVKKWVYSSHKKIKSNEVSKDFNGPFEGILRTESTDENSVLFVSGLSTLPTFDSFNNGCKVNLDETTIKEVENIDFLVENLVKE